jgi:LysM domain
MLYPQLPPAWSALTRLGAVPALALMVACSPGLERPALTAPAASATAPVAAEFVRASHGTAQTLPAGVGQAPAPQTLLNPRHPDRYVVQPGDTLWDIAAMFLRDPWYWPEIWDVNPQVANPHLIFPGDVLSLAFLDDGRPFVQVEPGATARGVERMSPRIRAEALEQAIPTIPYELLRSFLSRPTVLAKDEIERLPYIFAHPGSLIGSAGEDVYVRGGTAAVGAHYSVIHVGRPLVDPDDGAMIGYEGIYVGEGMVTAGGDPLTVRLTESTREALSGDYLVTEDQPTPTNFFPRAPERNVEGRIISVIDGVSLIGQYQVVVLNRGARDGLEPGSTLRVYQTGETVTDEVAKHGLFAEKVRLPDLPAGTMMVFRTYDRMSYALVMEATSEIRVLDTVRNP